MNKSAIKNFAVWARRKLISEITYRAGLLGVTEEGAAEPLPQSTKDLQFFDIGTRSYAEVRDAEITQRDALVAAIRAKAREVDGRTAFQNVVEEVAYTWFNRLIAIRFMEINDYLPSRVRVLSSEREGKLEPDFVTTPFDTDLDFTPDEREHVLQLKETNRLDELFRELFIRQCNKLHEVLPELFEETLDYTELLLTISFTDKDGVVYHLTHDIPAEDFDVGTEGQVEIIGWLYQYYNTEPKDEVFALLKKNVKITKERIPAATQLFTPDWIVRYMVENSLGRLWLEGHPNAELHDGWKYYLDEAEQEPEVQAQLAEIRKNYAKLNPEDIKIIDPCMGSGHILVYAFDVLVQIYEAQGYTQRDAARLIMEKNLYGLDIDKRAHQLAYFAVMMKARQYNRRILNGEVQPKLHAVQESNSIDRSHLRFLGGGMSELEQNAARTQLEGLLDQLTDAKEYGSILNVDTADWALLERYIDAAETDEQMSWDYVGLEHTQAQLRQLVRQAQVMAQKYDVVCTNPPYMGSSGMSAKLSEYVKKNYPDSKSDLFAVFIERCGQMAKQNGYQAMITQHAWMFLSSFEKLRTKLLAVDIVNMAHLGARAFEEIGGEVVQTTSFVIRESHIADYKGVYCRLIEPTTQQGKEDMFLAGENRYAADQSNFSKIPGSPVAYWVSLQCISLFDSNPPLNSVMDICQGMKTADNDRFLRLWHEPVIANEEKWYPYNKGGDFRRWYGNREYVVNWGDNGREVKAYEKSVIRNERHFFEEGLTWTLISSGSFGIRYSPAGSIFDGNGSMMFPAHAILLYTLGVLSSKVTTKLLSILSPTLTFEIGQLSKLPFKLEPSETIDYKVRTNIDISRCDWDSYETSWDFKRNPLL